jgi:hypothetical protein
MAKFSKKVKTGGDAPSPTDQFQNQFGKVTFDDSPVESDITFENLPYVVKAKPVADEPVADEPVADEPVADEPVADEPVADEPVAAKPKKKRPIIRLKVGASITAAKAPVMTMAAFCKSKSMRPNHVAGFEAFCKKRGLVTRRASDEVPVAELEKNFMAYGGK